MAEKPKVGDRARSNPLRSATVINNIIDAVAARDSRVLGEGDSIRQGLSAGNVVRVSPSFMQTYRAYVYHLTTFDLDEKDGQAFLFTGSSLRPINPPTSQRKNRAFISAEEMVYGEYRLAYAFGVCICGIGSILSATNLYAIPIADSYAHCRDFGNIEILSDNIIVSAEQRAVVRLLPCDSPFLIGTATGVSVAVDNMVTVNVDVDFGGRQVQAHNWLGPIFGHRVLLCNDGENGYKIAMKI